MDEQKAREILGGAIQSVDSLEMNDCDWIHWSHGDSDICLDGNFTADELEAMVWWMRNKGKDGKSCN